LAESFKGVGLVLGPLYIQWRFGMMV